MRGYYFFAIPKCFSAGGRIRFWRMSPACSRQATLAENPRECELANIKKIGNDYLEPVFLPASNF
ncbi:MAG: hypothetical protein A2Z83_01285 [Omnitrophica bacterium GWA2_52_8]|nr:MAG: hypothetical protein A2Z83_01285 [Omnitrophica bacterium GWA2_52_8]